MVAALLFVDLHESGHVQLAPRQPHHERSPHRPVLWSQLERIPINQFTDFLIAFVRVVQPKTLLLAARCDRAGPWLLLEFDEHSEIQQQICNRKINNVTIR